MQKPVAGSVDAYEIDDTENAGEIRALEEISPPDDVVHLTVERMVDVSVVGVRMRSPNAGMGKVMSPEPLHWPDWGE